MDTIFLENVAQLAAVIHVLDNDRDESRQIHTICHHEYASELVLELAKLDYTPLDIDLHDYNYNLYDKEYLVSVFNGDIYVEPCYREKTKYNNAGYFNIKGDLVFMHEDSNSKILKYIESPLIYEVQFEDDSEEACCCTPECKGCDDYCKCRCESKIEPEVKVLFDENNNAHGFNVTKTDSVSHMECSYYTSSNLSECDIQHILDGLKF